MRYFEANNWSILKNIFLFFFIITVSGNISAQGFNLKIVGQSEKEIKIIDSIGYVLKHKNAKSILDENNLFYEKLTRKGFLECQVEELLK